MSEHPAEMPLEADEADALEQSQTESATEDDEPDMTDRPLEMDEADAAEQARGITDADDDYVERDR